MKTRYLSLLLLLSVFLSSDIFAQKPADSTCTIVLHGHWSIQSSASLTDDGKVISQPGYTAKGWYPTSIPSTVLAALVANKMYPDPYYGNNYMELPGVRRWDKPEGNPFESSWWYRTEFDLPSGYAGKHVRLKFHSVNYRANLWVNGQKMADSTQMEGAYRLYSFDITQYTKAGQKNCLALEIYPPKTFDLTISWVDWNPTPPDRSMGIWYDVTLSASGPVTIEHPFVKTKLNLPSTDKAKLSVIAEVRNAESAPIKGLLKGTIENITFSKEVNLNAKEAKEVTFLPEEFPQLVVENPRLWWPHTVGPQNLYYLNLSFEIDGKVSDSRKTRFGIREITSWMNEFDTLRTKVFQVNGRNIVIRGGGYVEDLMLRPSNERVDADLRYLKFMNMNTLRMEAPRGSDYLFERCDEEGILIMVGWCCGLPFESWKHWTSHMTDIAEKSWRDQVVNLRAHPSVFTWLYGSDNFPPEDIERRYINVLRQYDRTRPYSSSATQAPGKIEGYTGLFMGPWPQVYGYLPPNYWYTDFQTKEIFSKEVTTGMKADESKILFKLDLPKELTNIYFVKLILQDKAGKEISSNFYWLSAKGDENADFTDLAKLPPVNVTTKLNPLVKENGKLKLVVEFTNSSTSLAFAMNSKLLSASTREPVLPIFWQDNYFSLLPGEKHTLEMQVDASLVTEEKLLFKLDGWNLRATHRNMNCRCLKRYREE